MKRKHVMRTAALILTVAILAGCGTQTAESNTNESVSEDSTQAASEDATETEPDNTVSENTEAAEATDTSEASATTENIKGGYPWLDTLIPENVTADMETSPGEDFYLYVNKDWILRGGKSSEGKQTSKEKIKEEILDLIENEDDSDIHETELLRDYYYAYTDWDARDKAGVEPLRPVVEDISSIGSLDELTAFLSDEERSRDIVPAIKIDNTVTDKDPDHYVTLVHFEGFSGTLLEDPDAYNGTTKKGEATKAAAKDLVAYGLEGLGWTPDEAGKAFDDYIAYEKLLFEHLYSIAQMYSEDFVQEYKYTDREGLQEMMKEFPIQGILNTKGFGEAREICYDNGDYLKHLGDLYTEENLEMLKNYYIVSYLLEFASECDSRSNALADKVLGAAYSQLNTDSFTDLDNVFNYYKSSLSNAMNKAYLARHDVSGLKAETAALFEEIKTTYRDMLMAEDWLSEESKKNVIEKIDAMGIYSLYPDHFINYDGLDLKGRSYFDMITEIRHFNQDIEKEKVDAEIDREEAAWRAWDMYDINAKNIREQNMIIVTLGYIEHVGLGTDTSREELLGRLGVTMGHEISHGFDKYGVMFDKDGRRNSIFTEDDQAEFDERANKVADYFKGITIFEGHTYNGISTLEEAIADITGFGAMLALAENDENFDYDKFFRVYATHLRHLSSYDQDAYNLTSDAHPLNNLRVNVIVQQYEKFYETYDVKEGDTMYLAPEDRICIW